MVENTNTNHGDGDEDDIDGCVCGVEFNAGTATLDSQLPPAFGGVAEPSQPPENEDGIDGCDAIPSGTNFTTDEELPPAVGGVA
jgi:hypothetical protein